MLRHSEEIKEYGMSKEMEALINFIDENQLEGLVYTKVEINAYNHANAPRVRAREIIVLIGQKHIADIAMNPILAKKILETSQTADFLDVETFVCKIGQTEHQITQLETSLQEKAEILLTHCVSEFEEFSTIVECFDSELEGIDEIKGFIESNGNQQLNM